MPFYVRDFGKNIKLGIVTLCMPCPFHFLLVLVCHTSVCFGSFFAFKKYKGKVFNIFINICLGRF
jgi:hypothetical protein